MQNPKHKIPCVILCGGKSSRMGEDKALLPFSSYNSLSEFQYERLKPYFQDIYLSAKTNKFNFDANIIYDIYDNASNESSPMIALKSILETIKEDKVFILTVDTPFVSSETINKLINASKDHDVTYASCGKDHYLCAVFSKSLLKTIEEFLNEDIHKMGFLIKNSNSKKLSFDDEKEFLNLNNKDEYKEALKILEHL